MLETVSAMVELSETDLQSLYAWIDEVPLSRPKKSIARDFSDGVMAAEIVSHFFPRLVDLHSYSPANSTNHKLENWRLLNRKVFSKLDFNVPDELLVSVVSCKPGVIEYILDHLKSKIEHILEKNSSKEMSPLTTTRFPDTDHFFNSSAGNTVTHQMQDNRHMIVSPAPQLQQKQNSLNLPPLVKSPMGPVGLHPMTHPSKVSKPSHIPRPAHSRNSPTSRHTLPPMTNQGQLNGGVPWGSSQTKLPVIKDGIKVHKGTKKDTTYASQRLGGPAHWFRRPSNNKDGNLSKDGMLVMAEKDQMIMELQETVQLLQMKVKRLEHLIKIKDYKLQDLEKHSNSNTGKSGQTMR